MQTDKMLVGALEVCSLPDLGISDIKVRVDTGAQTSSLHVDNVQTITYRGKPWIEFDIHPDLYHVEEVVRSKAPLKDVRWVKSSNGAREQRYVITTTLVMGPRSWPILITLTDRSEMNYLMLLGRQGMADQLLVDPSQTFICSNEID
ncbi:ATP-dependent zinc protease [Gayadomonas joobiniege]|uniref:ATP-dependent zinc protease family protein n=1 Tax=Gayadomonas joobiniege TaxID=1234606 RepID=UPI00035F1AA0|nr:RimK/LysX family protein [Gayadomonas joobiniege]